MFRLTALQAGVFLFSCSLLVLPAITQMDITITGKMALPENDTPLKFPSGSYLLVKLEDVSMMDASSILCGQNEVDLLKYKKGQPLEYRIVCARPRHGVSFSVSAVLNNGWKGSGDEWIRRGDYLTDTSFHVDLKKDQNEYRTDIHMIHYT